MKLSNEKLRNQEKTEDYKITQKPQHLVVFEIQFQTLKNS